MIVVVVVVLLLDVIAMACYSRCCYRVVALCTKLKKTHTLTR